MNLKDFKEWLNQFPDDTIVETLDVNCENDDATIIVREFNPDITSTYYQKYKRLRIGSY